MPTGQPDSRFFPADVEPVVDRIIRAAMESGEFDNLPGQGQPIPGAGMVDDEMWWVRSWVERNRRDDGQAPSSSS